MKRYIRIHPHRIAVAGLEFTPDWQTCDVTAEQLDRIEACGQLEVTEEAPRAYQPPVTLLTAAELTAAKTAGTLVPGGLYLTTNDGALNVATSATTVKSYEAA
jgi:hypothetical protein